MWFHPFRFAALAAGCLIIAGVLSSCGSDDTITDPNQNQSDKGFITGVTFLAGDPSRTNQIVIRVVDESDESEADTTFPDDDGIFLTRGLDNGTYRLTATAPIPGYGTATRNGIPVVPGETTPLGLIDIPDTSRVRILNITPTPFSNVIPRRPAIEGDLFSDGSGIKVTSFSIIVNGIQQSNAATITLEDLARGHFSYSPDANFTPGEIDVRVRIGNRAGNSSVREWEFTILDGIKRRVPTDYANIWEAYRASNEGDTVYVDPGIHEVSSTLIRGTIVINREITILAAAIVEGGRPEDTVLVPRPGKQHFLFDNVTDQVLLKGFLLRDGDNPGVNRNGGSIECNAAGITVEQCIFENNRAESGQGGAISLRNGSDALIRDCVFRGNRSTAGGAIAVFFPSRPTIERCLFIRNEARVSDANNSGGVGGAVYTKSSYPLIRQCTMYQNFAGRSGGALMLDGDAQRGDARVTSTGNLYIDNASPEGTIRLHIARAEIEVDCDGFQRAEEQATIFSGPGGRVRLGEHIEIDPSTDPGFCNVGTLDLGLRLDSPFTDLPCEAGASGVGCN